MCLHLTKLNLGGQKNISYVLIQKVKSRSPCQQSKLTVVEKLLAQEGGLFRKKRNKFGSNSNYLNDVFKTGAEIGKKANPAEVPLNMRTIASDTSIQGFLKTG